MQTVAELLEAIERKETEIRNCTALHHNIGKGSVVYVGGTSQGITSENVIEELKASLLKERDRLLSEVEGLHRFVDTLNQAVKTSFDLKAIK